MAFDIKYHLACLISVERSAESSVGKQSQPESDLSLLLSDIEIVEILELELNYSTGKILNMNDINAAYIARQSNRQSQVYETHKENAATKDLIWLLCYLYWQSKENSSREGDQEMCDPASVTAGNQNKFEKWAAFNSLSATEKVSKTNCGVIGPLIGSPPTSPQTLCTAL